jgi:nucleotide-binding universal stress UspA family protein
MDSKMIAHILLAVDGSACSSVAARHGIALARALGARLTVVTVTTPWAVQFAREPAAVVPGVIVPENDYEARTKAAAADILRSVADTARQAGLQCRTLHCRHRDAYQAILDTAAGEGCDLIVVGSHGRRGISKALLGSEANKVVSHSTLPVLVVRATAGEQ